MEFEEPNEELCEENKANLEKKKGRRFKTPSQVQALEEFYNEHKYPTESMKTELGNKLGLTERQVSGWFCHRRLKDKKLMKDETLGTGRQDLSSGVIQDRGSGLRQDSCGSTKQTELRPSDAREVESRRLSREAIPPLAQPTYELRQQFDATATDDTSSESDSDLQEEQGFYPQSRNMSNAEVSHYVMPNGFALKPRGRSGPSGYLKIKGQTENAAITAVKRQLGSHYRIDGPPLGVDFEPLPPGAFEFPAKHTAHEAYRGLEPFIRSPLDMTAHSKQASVYDRTPDSYEEPVNMRMFCGSDRDSISYRTQMKPKSFASPNHLSHPYEKSPLGAEHPTLETSARDSRLDSGVRSSHGLKAPRPNSFLNRHVQSATGKIAIDQGHTLKHEHDNLQPKILNRKEIREPRAPSSTVRRRDSFDSNERVPSGQMAKNEELYELKRSKPLVRQDGVPYMGNRSLGGHPPSRVKRGRDETQRQNFAVPSFQDQSQWANPVKQSAPENPSSFSEDETAETSSSVD